MLKSSDTALLFPAGRPPGLVGGSAHFFHRRDAHNREPRTDYDRGRRDQSKPRPRLTRQIGLQESKRRIVLASVPQHMKIGRQVIEKKRYPVRFARNSGGFHSARPKREATDQG